MYLRYEMDADRVKRIEELEQENTELLIANKQHMEKILTMGQVMEALVRKLGEAQKENEFLEFLYQNRLTNRQAELLRSLKAGMTVDQIAEAMGIEKGSVVWHKNKLFKKMGVGTTGEAVRMCREGE